MMMYCGEILTSLTVSAKPAERGDGVGDDIREFECWVVKEGDWVISGDVCCEIYALNCATEYKENSTTRKVYEFLTRNKI